MVRSRWPSRQRARGFLACGLTTHEVNDEVASLDYLWAAAPWIIDKDR